MEVAEHQVQWGREEAEEEREDEEVLQMRRQKRPDTVTAVNLSGVSSGVAIDSGIEEEEEEDSEKGSNSNYEHSVTEPENGKPKDEYSVPENGKSKDEYSLSEKGKSKDEYSESENGKSKDEYAVSENGKSKDEYSESENSKTRYELVVPKNCRVQVFDHDDNGHDQSTVINNQHQGNTKDETLSDIKLLPIEKSAEDPKETQSSNDMIVGDEGSNDFDVERVLREQDTHDLICPNCQSCITKRVILRKRKRNVKSSDEDVKRNRPQVVGDSQLDVISEHTTDIQGDTAINTTVDSSSQTPAADEYNQPEVFRCLSCFTFFIPKGNGVNVFNLFGDKREKENLQNREQTSSTKKNWFFSLFGPRKVEVLLDGDVEANISVASGQELGSSEPPLVVSYSPGGPAVATNIVASTGDTSITIHKEATEAVGPEITPSGTLLPGKGTVHGESLEKFNTYYKPQRDGLQNFDPATEASAPKKSQQDQKLDARLVKDTDGKDWLFPNTVSVYGESENDKAVGFVAGFPSQNGQNIGVKQAMPTPSTVEVQNVGVTFSDSSYSEGGPQNNVSTKVDIHVEKTTTANADASIPSPTTSLLLPDRAANATKYLIGLPEKTSAGHDSIITITESQTETSQQAQDIIASAVTGLSDLREGSETRESKGVEVIKSIVYGGLVEVVTSLGVVSSAAGSETAIINILALGLANLVGGLFMLSHNLWDLRNDDYGLISNQANENEPSGRTRRLDKYQDLLGRRENFILHATLAILSFLIFGSLPPVIYGFSFRLSNDRYFKLLTVAVASFLCITVLAVCKAYVQRPPKGYIKTVFKYMSLGFMASGVSYVAGDLIKKSLDKLGWFGSGADLSLPIMRELPVQTGWGSY